MGFSGGGSNILKPHKHNSLVLQDGGNLDFKNDTQSDMSASSMTYSDGSHLQELSVGSEGADLRVIGGTPTWSTGAVVGSANQRFIYWFSGSVFGTLAGGQSEDGVWSMRENVGGTPTFTYDDDNKGLLVTPATPVAWPQMDFNGVIPFIETASTIIGSVSFTVGASSGEQYYGMSGTIDTSQNQSALIENNSTQVNMRAQTKGVGVVGNTDTGVPVSTGGTFYTVKIVCKAASIDFYIDGTLRVTATTNLPTISMSPKFYAINRTAGQQILVNIRFVEAWND